MSTTTQYRASARVTDRGIRYTTERVGEPVGSFCYGDHVQTREALSAVGVPAPVATRFVLGAYHRRDDSDILLTLRGDGGYDIS